MLDHAGKSPPTPEQYAARRGAVAVFGMAAIDAGMVPHHRYHLRLA